MNLFHILLSEIYAAIAMVDDSTKDWNESRGNPNSDGNQRQHLNPADPLSMRLVNSIMERANPNPSHANEAVDDDDSDEGIPISALGLLGLLAGLSHRSAAGDEANANEEEGEDQAAQQQASTPTPREPAQSTPSASPSSSSSRLNRTSVMIRGITINCINCYNQGADGIITVQTPVFRRRDLARNSRRRERDPTRRIPRRR